MQYIVGYKILHKIPKYFCDFKVTLMITTHILCSIFALRTQNLKKKQLSEKLSNIVFRIMIDIYSDLWSSGENNLTLKWIKSSYQKYDKVLINVTDGADASFD